MAYVFQTKRKNGKAHMRWRFQFTDWQGNRRTGTGATSKAETKRLAEKLQAEHDEIRKGYRPVPNPWNRHRNRPFGEVAEEYLAWGTSQGGRGGRPWGAGHARMRQSLMKWWQERLGLEKLADLEGILPRVGKTLRELMEKRRSGKTLTNYAECIRGFGNWCVRRGYLGEDPIKGLSAFDMTPKTKRRALTKEELCRLLSAAPEHRRLLYSVAMCSGLRAGELRALTVNDLDTVNGGLHLHAEWTKNRKPGFQPLPVSLVQTIECFAQSGAARGLYIQFLRNQDGTTEVPENPLLYVPSHPARDLEEDLDAAKIPKHNSEGKVDFHSCRVTYVTFLLEAGASAKEAQALARHATPEMTMNHYARVRDGRLADVVERVGDEILNFRNTISAQRPEGRFVTPSAKRSYVVEAAGIETSSICGFWKL